MTPFDIMSECQRSGVDLGMDGIRGLTFRGNREAVNRLLPTIKAHKPGLLAILAGNPPIPGRLSKPITVNGKTRQWDYQRGCWFDGDGQSDKPRRALRRTEGEG